MEPTSRVDKKNFLKGRLSDDWFCLAYEMYEPKTIERRGHTVSSLQRLIKKKRLDPQSCWVQTICGSSERKMIYLEVKHLKYGPINVLADVVTGSLYNPDTGECYTGNLKIKEI